MTKEELGYVAGIIDGEGCILIYKGCNPNGRPKYNLRLNIKMCCKKVIERIKELVGAGSTYCCLSNDWKRHNYYAFVIQGKQAAILLQLICHLLIEKKEQALLAIEFQDMFTPKSGKRSGKRASKEINNIKETFYKTMKKLKFKKFK